MHEWKGGPELLVSYCDGSDALREIKLLEPVFNNPEKTGTAKNEDGSAKKQNRGIFINDVYMPLYANCSPTSQTIQEFIEESAKKQYTPLSAFQSLYSLKGWDILFSGYKNGDFYKAHRDDSKMTVLLWLGEKDFKGGDLYFPDFDYAIEYEPNKLIMFPSHYQHEVTPISTDQEGFVRYCASAFIN